MNKNTIDDKLEPFKTPSADVLNEKDMLYSNIKEGVFATCTLFIVGIACGVGYYQLCKVGYFHIQPPQDIAQSLGAGLIGVGISAALYSIYDYCKE